MAARWTSDHVVAEYRDLQANCMALDCTGQYAVLAGRRSVALIQLDQPSVPVKKVFRQSKWEVTAGEWSPHRQELFALASNQRAEVLCWRDSELTHHQMLRAHTRAISDLNWSSFDSNVLATASIDTFIYIWDIRDARRPAISLSAAAGASQVKWNKVSENILATCHEGDLRLWDPRQTTTPIQYVTAHLAKIYGLDWSPTHEHQLATSSQDCSVKFWDITNPRRVEGVLTCLSPVWRARYTPFGDGLVTVVVPRLHRGENNLVLWNLTSMSNLTNPIHTFVGHSDVVLEFAWRRKRDVGSKDYELVSWSKDESLRIWVIDSSLQRLCGHEAYLENEETDFVISSGQGNSSQDVTDVTSVASQTSPRETEAGGQSTPPQTPYKSPDKVEPVTPPPTQPQNLEREFSLVNMNIPNITINEMDITNRTCTVTAVNRKHTVCLKITFPNSYPNNSSPTFHFCKATNVDSDVKAKLLKVVRMVSQQQVKRNRSCLEPCLRQLVTTLEACTAADDSDQDNDLLDPAKQQFIPLPFYGSLQDVSVPFPRTSGARFCGADFLVCFVRPPHLQRANVPTESAPRSLSALGAYLSSHLLPLKGRQTQSVGQYSLVYQPVAQSPTGDSGVSISSFYRPERKQKLQSNRSIDGEKRRLANQKSATNCGAVLIYSISRLIPVNRHLAETYVLGDHNLPAICKKNANKAADVGRKDLVQVWSLCSLITCPLLKPSLDPDDGRPWAQHPFARQMIQKIIDHYISRHDVQTVAMLCCTFGKKNDDNQKNKKAVCEGSSGSQHSGKWWLKPGGSPYHTVVPADTQWDGWNLVGALKRNRSNSWSDSLEECRFFDCIPDPKEVEREAHEANIELLDPKLLTKYDQFKKAYAEILYQWNLLTQRAQILKYSTAVPEKHKGVEFLTECQGCHNDARGVQCLRCKNYSLNCSVCHIAVRGTSAIIIYCAANYCLACGHGGHALHMMDWFAERTSCPAGCGCSCLEENDIFG